MSLENKDLGVFSYNEEYEIQIQKWVQNKMIKAMILSKDGKQATLLLHNYRDEAETDGITQDLLLKAEEILQKKGHLKKVI